MTAPETTPPAAAVRSFVPQSIRHELLLTALKPLSHHDASVQDDSNRNLFNRQAILVPGDGADYPPVTSEQANELAAQHPVPAQMVQLMADLSLPEFLATVLVRTFIDEFNSRDGAGLFAGMERYQMLGNRVPHAAYAGSLRRFYSRLTTLMQVGIPKKSGDELLLRLFAAPAGAQSAALHVLRTQGHDIMRLARFWHDAKKQEAANYLKAAKASKQVQSGGLGLGLGGVDPALMAEVLGGDDIDETREMLTARGYDADGLLEKIYVAIGGEKPGAPVVMQFAESQLTTDVGSVRKLEIPHLTANSVRHQLLREPAMRHLFAALDIEPESLPAGVEAIFYNGGNIKSGATQPSNPALLSRQVRAAFPSLDLLGGVTNSFDLGESGVSVGSILVCRETRHLLPEWARELPATKVSAFDLIEDSTLTRQAGRTGQGQMIFGFENLIAGAQFLVTLDFKSYTTTQARGAAMSAIREWQKAPTLGGGSARGYGEMRVDDWRRPDAAGDDAALGAYEAYLENHAEALKAELLSGKLGASGVVVS